MTSTIDPNWARWIMASVTQHFRTKLKPTAPVFVSGVQFIPEEVKDFFEIRVDGPHLREWSIGFWRVYVEVSILIQSSMDQSDGDIYRLQQNIGITQASFLGGIPILKKGDGEFDTGERIGCLSLLRPKYGRDSLEANNFGQVGPQLGLMQAAVEGHFDMLICT